MKKRKDFIEVTLEEFAELVGLPKADAIQAEIKAQMMNEVHNAITKSGLTHQEIADLSGVGRTVITQMVNFSIQKVTLDRLLKVLLSLGIYPEIKYRKVS